jgi:ribosomal protein S20
MMLSQFPQVSKEFKEEQEGMQAAYLKAQKTVAAAETAYDTTKDNVVKVQKSLDRVKGDIDKGVAYTNKASSEVSKYYERFNSLKDSLGKETKGTLGKQGGAENGAVRGAIK